MHTRPNNPGVIFAEGTGVAALNECGQKMTAVIVDERTILFNSNREDMTINGDDVTIRTINENMWQKIR
jgi:hypothetical protein